MRKYKILLKLYVVCLSISLLNISPLKAQDSSKPKSTSPTVKPGMPGSGALKSGVSGISPNKSGVIGSKSIKPGIVNPSTNKSSVVNPNPSFTRSSKSSSNPARKPLLRTLRRDSLRAGFAVHIKGKVYRISTPEGRHLHDSLSHPLTFRKLAALKRDSSSEKHLEPKNNQKDSSKAIPILKISEHKSVIPFFIQNPRLNSRIELLHMQTMNWIEKTYTLEKFHKLLINFPSADKHHEAFIKGRPFVQSGTARPVRPLWIVFILLIILFMVALVKTVYPRDLHEIFEGLFNDRSIRNNREAGMTYSPSFILMFIGFCLVAGLMIYDYLLFQKIEFSYSAFSLYLIICLGVFCFFIAKLILYWISAWVFDIDHFLKPYQSFLYITLANFTIVGLPFLIIYSFNSATLLKHLVVWIPFIFVFFFIFLYLRSIVYSISNFKFQKFYLFLYFCAFEICPLIIVFKLING